MLIRPRSTGHRQQKAQGPSSIDVDFSDCPLAQRYPTWDAYHEQLAEERAAAIREGRRLIPPPLSLRK